MKYLFEKVEKGWQITCLDNDKGQVKLGILKARNAWWDKVWTRGNKPDKFILTMEETPNERTNKRTD